MKRSLIIAGLGTVCLGCVWYSQSPHWAVAGLQRAAVSGDPVALRDFIDVPVLREQLRHQIAAAAIAPTEPSRVLDAILLTTASEPVIDQMLSPASIKSVMAHGDFTGSAGRESAGQRSSLGWTIDRRGLDTFLAEPDLPTGQHRSRLVFHREGIGWRLVAIEGSGIGSIARERRSSIGRTSETDALRDLILDFPADRKQRSTLANGVEFAGVSGSITNVGMTWRDVPQLRLTIRNRANEVVAQRDLTTPSRLAPGQSLTVNEAVTDIPKDGIKLDVDWKL